MKYNDDQTKWRWDMFMYMARLPEFKKDLFEGKINIEDWGLIAESHPDGDVVVSMKEEKDKSISFI